MASAPGSGPAPSGDGPAWLARLYDLIGYVAAVILAIMAASVFASVVGRWVGRGIEGIDELPRFLFVWLVALGGAAAMWRHEHTVLDYFINLAPPRLRHAIALVVNVTMIGLFAYLVVLSGTLVPNSQFQTSAGLNLPLGYVYAAVPVGALLIILPLLRNVIGSLRGLGLPSAAAFGIVSAAAIAIGIWVARSIVTMLGALWPKLF
jgi:TRAP-type C4-dicarboxylate transport system permease small subunit